MKKYIQFITENKKIDKSDINLNFKSVYGDECIDIKSAKIKCDKYICRIETISGKQYVSDDIEMTVCYNLNGDYIGDEKEAKIICKKYNIDPELIDSNHKVCSIGFNDKENKWYGWSHRAIYGFGIGSEVKIGSCGFKPSNVKEFIKSLKSWYDDDMYKNLKFIEKTDGVQIEYDIIPKSNEEYSYLIESNDYKLILKSKLQLLLEKNNTGEIHHTSTFEKFPKTWGKGEWKAKTLEDAKEMAIDFANAVS
jgi:hypothetical protein